jgi:hypothetical protein
MSSLGRNFSVTKEQYARQDHTITGVTNLCQGTQRWPGLPPVQAQLLRQGQACKELAQNVKYNANSQSLRSLRQSSVCLYVHKYVYTNIYI